MSERTIRVLALEQGFYGGSRRRAGTEFEMLEKDLGERVPLGENAWTYNFPSWVRLATDLTKRLFEKHQKDAEQKAIGAAIASSGDAFAKIKKKSFADAMRNGPNLDERAEAAAIAASGDKTAKVKKQAIEDALGAGRGRLSPVK